MAFSKYIKNCECIRLKKTDENQELHKLLPGGYEYALCDFEGSGNTFTTRFRINISTKAELRKWLEAFSITSNESYRVSRTFPENGKKLVYKVYMHCHHNTHPSSHKVKNPSVKHTNCPAQMSLTVKNTIFSRKYKSKDFHLPDMPTMVILKHDHNHRIDVADSVKFKLPNEKTKEQFLNLFHEGYTPSGALSKYLSSLKTELGDDYFTLSSDRSVCPDIQWVFHVYYQEYKKEYGVAYGQSMFDCLKDFIENYNQEHSERCAKFFSFGDNFFVVIVTPLMKRILENISTASDILFADSSGNVDRYGCKVFMLMINSCCGGLPVGCIITSSESETTLTSAIKLYSELLSEKSFNGRGKLGPKIIMSDDCTAERNSFKTVFPESQLLLCIFHVLQAAWRFLCNSKNCIPHTKRQEIYSLIKRMVYAETVEYLDECFQEFTSSSEVALYPKLINYVQKLYQRKEEWALAFRSDMLTRGQNTNNICEAAIKVLKSNILKRTKAYSVVQLFHILATEMEDYYQNRILDVANGRAAQHLKKNIMSASELKKFSAKEHGNDYKVTNLTNKKEYFVQVDIGVCSCPVGQSGAPCKHQKYIHKKYNVPFHIILPSDAENRKNLFYVATGKDVAAEWFASLKLPEAATEKNTHTMIPVASTSDETQIINEASTSGEILHQQIDAVNDKNKVDDILRKETILSKLDTVFHTIKVKAENNPDVLIATEKFINSFDNIHTESKLVSALSTFGKFTGFFEKKKLVSCKKIGVQSTAMARRKISIGRQCTPAGRPPKRSYVPEHGYNVGSAPKSTLLPGKKRKAPHNLSYCVSENKSLGKK